MLEVCPMTLLEMAKMHKPCYGKCPRCVCGGGMGGVVNGKTD